MNKKKILFVAYGGGHANIVAQLYHSIDQSKYDLEVLAISTSRVIYEKEKIPFRNLTEFIRHEDKVNFEKLSSLARTQTFHPQIPEPESLAYFNLNLIDLIDQLGFDSAIESYTKSGRFCFYPLNLMKRILQDTKPDLVITTNSPRAEQAAIDAAKQMGIKSVCVVDLLTLYEVKGFLSHPGHGTKICVFNERAKKLLIENGRPETEIVVTGNPAFDRIFAPEYLEKAKTYVEKFCLTNKTVIVWARSAVEADKEKLEIFEDQLVNFCSRRGDVFLIIRLHPNEHYTKTFNLKNIHLSRRDEEIYTVVYASDIVVTFYSTVGIEASLIGKTVIQPSDTSLFNDFNLVEQDIALEIKSSLPFESQMQKHLEHHQQIKNLQKTNRKTDSTSLVKFVIETLI